jgi:exodeoxyribonuclease VII large subunit
MMPTILSVRELTHYIREVLEFDDLLADVWVEGEVSNLSRSSAGHVYFTLKESDAQLSCVFFRGMASRLARLPQDGDAILVHGRVSFYEAGGRLQLYVDMLRPLGLGALFLRFQELKERLEQEGLFDVALKRDLPPFPLRIGVVTSPTAAALQDILHVLRRRYPLVEVVLSPTLVQGKDAAPQIVAALDRLYEQQVDLIIISRGGGSLEDLWPFNEEIVARAIRAAPVPVVSGVGHETDFTIADFAADLRAPTPSAAAEVSVPNQEQLRQQLLRFGEDLHRVVQQQALQARLRLEERTQQLQRLSPAAQIADRRQRVDDGTDRLFRGLQHRLAVTRERLRSAALRLDALGPASTLQRGYAIVRRRKDGAVVVSPGEVASGDALDVQVRDGAFEVEVIE